MYVDPEELVAIVLEAQAMNTITERLMQVINAIIDRLRKHYRWMSVEDWRQNCYLRLLVVLQRIDTTLNVFAYLMKLVHMQAIQQVRSEGSRLRMLNRYAQILRERS